MKESDIDYNSMSIEDRMMLTENIFVIHPEVKYVLRAIELRHEESRLKKETKGLLITGGSGCGKSTVAKCYLEQFPRQETKEGTVIPVLLSAIFAPATVKSIATGMLRSMGDPFADKGTITSLTIRLYELIDKCKVELIILDEFQHLIDRESFKVLLNAANWLKNLMTETGVHIVLLGMPWSDIILQTDSQLRRRFQARVDLTHFNWHICKGKTDFRRFIKMADKSLPFLEWSNFADTENAFRFYCATRGVISNVMSIIKAATRYALMRKSEKVDLVDLAQAYSEQIGNNGQINENPFEINVEKLVAPSVEPMETLERTTSKRGRWKEKIAASDVLKT